MRWLVAGAGHSVCDPWMTAFEAQCAEHTIVLADGPEVAGEARRLAGQTLIVQVLDDLDSTEFDGVIDLTGRLVTTAPRCVLPAPARVLLQQLLSAVQIQRIVGAIQEPAIATQGGVEALAGQVSQLFNGRDPDPGTFGGTLAFNQLRRDSAAVEQWVRDAQGLAPDAVALTIHQTDLFYTATASLWIEAEVDAIDALVGQANCAMDACTVAAPGRGRAEESARWQMATRRLTPTAVQVQVYADTETGLWVPAILAWMDDLQRRAS
ncbi:MAG: hypothetical protein ACO31Z_07340 [Litorivicinaceae bacterium]